MTNYAVGHLAEKYAREYIQKKGYKIIDANWKNRFGEIDIIAKQKKCIYFIEVKYRKNTSQGSGIDYITATKLKQMRFAAEMWANNNKWRGEYVIGAIELSGANFGITNFLPAL